jgi:hypothetical protein
MRQDDLAEAPGSPVTTLLTQPGILPRVGETLVCPTCAVSGVVRALPAPPGAGPSCHGPMKIGRPVPCDEVRPRRSDDVMIGGHLYGDEISGFVFWCTRGGPRQVQFYNRPLQLKNAAFVAF